ncbi:MULTISPECIES: nucleoside deaminase [unclassified Paracoccus (in: a-proteobacteria)]|uniref:nucleoside deaminase n=1 Tax=unclassified Paracoccus (in: a-proteobacteria) TaxID=2688777 RepID=UPI0012B2AEF0|nr:MULTISPECIES: nucleoside deaminase [unclassified Paracoccus (in: a-proteobacteria)]UXU76481.1 nucleoside deaminase [Paracoccus sp. SMMA_5]UXU82181.1 nucleoside deaminase [Paracoccus sp. SMMA_5_TC]
MQHPPDSADPTPYLAQAIQLAHQNARAGGRPFGAVVVRDGRVIATAVNRMAELNDPTAHAEMLALRNAAQALGSIDLSGCRVYASGQPCPMCLAAMRMAGIAAVSYAYSNDEAEPHGLSTAAVYRELALPLAQQSMAIAHHPLRLPEVGDLYGDWRQARR